MNFEDLGRVWQEQGTGDFQRRKVESLSTVRGRAEKLLGGVHRGGKWLVGFTLLLCVPVFSWGVLNSERPWLAAPGVLILWGWTFYLVRLALSLGRPKGARPVPVRDAVESEVHRLGLLERFWGNAHWLFLTFLVGEVMAYEGFRPAGLERGPLSVGFYVALIVIVLTGTLGRRRDARSKVRPLREELEGWLAGLEAFDFDSELDAGLQGGAQ